MLVVDFSKLLKTNSHAILDEALHVTVDLQVLLLNQLLILILQSTFVDLCRSLQSDRDRRSLLLEMCIHRLLDP